MRLYELDQKRILAMFEQVEKSLDEFGKRMDIWEKSSMNMVIALNMMCLFLSVPSEAYTTMSRMQVYSSSEETRLSNGLGQCDPGHLRQHMIELT